MKTVLHVIDTTGPGGAETIFLQLAKKVAENGHKSIALIRGNGWVQSQLEQFNIPFYIIDCKGSFNLKYLLSLIKLIRTEKVDVIQSHLLGSSVYCSMAGIITKTRVISTFHGMVDISPNERFRKIKLMALQLGCDKIVAVTDVLYKMICDLGTIKSTKITTICNGIDINLYKKIETKEYRNKLNINDNEILIGSLGNIRTPKNYSLAIKTIKEIHKQGWKVHYAIAGQGNDQQMAPLQQLISELNLTDYVHILGFTKKTQSFLSSIDIFLMSSSSEGHPLALTQAMANALPIVSTKSGVELIAIDEKEAIISSSMTPANLASALISLLNDNSLAKTIGQNAFDKAKEKFTLDAMFHTYFKLYVLPEDS
ncbi:MAG TPA: glycosyltransferase [Gammaproteobacteria bacterium]|nr:glycosyltransferase [Gammaproteobacteria bacterium]